MKKWVRGGAIAILAMLEDTTPVVVEMQLAAFAAYAAAALAKIRARGGRGSGRR